MELLTILLAGLLTTLSPVGLILDRAAQNNIRSRFDKIEQLQVRVDNAPTQQLLAGKVNRIRIAGRGLWLTPDVRFEALELETDPVDVDLKRLRQGDKNSLMASLKQPGQAGVRLVLTEKDINKALESPQVKARLQQSLKNGGAAGDQLKDMEIKSASVKFLADNRIAFLMQLKQPSQAQVMDISLESELSVISGRKIQLIKPVAFLNGKSIPAPFLKGFISNINKRLDLNTLADKGILARLLQLKIDGDRIKVAAFVRVQGSN